ncbi:MAG: nucleotidyltransferase domain-containing protein [Eggerthellaceae bacterium]|nr:nucleotidyltransferase domain-containing protein [Eggerthellaceae bacterium]
MELRFDHISEIVCETLRDYDVREAYLFGSFARGDQTAESDVDLRFVCSDGMTYGTLYEISQRLEGRLGRSVQIITNPLERMRPAFRERLQRDEVLLYAAA